MEQQLPLENSWIYSLPFILGASFPGQDLFVVYLDYYDWSTFQKFLNTRLSPL